MGTTKTMASTRRSPLRLSCLMCWSAFALAGCAFEDPNAPPPPDPCVQGAKGQRVQGLWAIVDGPASCASTNPARPEGDDTVVFYSGSAWSAEAAHCRAINVFLGAAPVGDPDLDADGVPDVTIERDFTVPLDAIGYCLINEGTPSEITAYSTCGIQSAGKSACEQLLANAPDAKVTARWFDCPGGPGCAPKPDDGCLAEVGDGSAYAGFVDDPDFVCRGTPEESVLSDAQDSLLVVTGTRFNLSSALCAAAGPYNKQGVATYGVGPISRISTRDPATKLPVLDPARDPVPNGLAGGYCLFNRGLAEEFALYALCDGLSQTADKTGTGTARKRPILTRKERCAGFVESRAADGSVVRSSVWGNKIPFPRAGEWVDCPEGSLCNLPLKPVR